MKDAQSVNQAYRSYVNAKQALASGLATNKQSVQNAQKSVKDATASLNAGVLKDQQSIHTARASVKSAKQTLAGTRASNEQKAEPATEGALANARAQITTAQTALENALAAQKQMTLVAPAAGTVASITGAVGESPGGAASGSSSDSSDRVHQPGRPSRAPGGRDLQRDRRREDQARPGRRRSPSTRFRARQLAAHVVSVDTTQTVVNNVVTYGVTLVLDRTDAGLKPGMTVSAAVIVAKRDGVLHVPNAAVRHHRRHEHCHRRRRERHPDRAAVTTGLVGDDSTEIVSGLKAGGQRRRLVRSRRARRARRAAGSGGAGGVGGGRVPQVFGGP